MSTSEAAASGITVQVRTMSTGNHSVLMAPGVSPGAAEGAICQPWRRACTTPGPPSGRQWQQQAAAAGRPTNTRAGLATACAPCCVQASVAELKQLLVRPTGLPVERQRVIYGCALHRRSHQPAPTVPLPLPLAACRLPFKPTPLGRGWRCPGPASS